MGHVRHNILIFEGERADEKRARVGGLQRLLSPRSGGQEERRAGKIFVKYILNICTNLYHICMRKQKTNIEKN